jgi:ribonuclease P protein component
LKISPVVSKKISKKAVVRNKIKRRIRHLIAMHFNSGKFVVIALCDVSKIDFNELVEDVKTNRSKIDKCL